MGQPAAREADEIHQQGQSLSVVPRRDIHIDDPRRRITQHIALEGLALDSEPADGTGRPEKLAHRVLPPASADVIRENDGGISVGGFG
jgi:hypothetical protein